MWGNDVTVVIRVDATQFFSEIERVGATAVSFGRALGEVASTGGGIFTAAMSKMGEGATAGGNLIGKAFSSIGGWIQDLAAHVKWASFLFGQQLVGAIQDAVNMAAQFERFGIAAEYLTGSADAAKEFAAAVKEVAVTTMFNVDQIAQMEARLVGNTRNVGQSTIALKALTEAVAATGGSFSELEGATRAWIQINSKANLSSEELNRQFANANIPVVRLLAESIAKDLNHPLRQYLDIAGQGTGVSKTLATSFKTASTNINVLELGVKRAEAGMAEYNATGKKSSEQDLAHQIALDKARIAYDKAKGTINEYTTAVASQGKAVGAAKLSVEDIMAQLQTVGDLKIPGKIGAEAVTRALNEAYGGANLKLIQTFSGQISMLGDVLKITMLRFMGLDESFRPVEGGLLNLLTNGLKPLVKFLQDNQEQIADWANKISTSKPVLLGLAFAITGVLIPSIVALIAPLVELSLFFGGVSTAIGYALTSVFDFSTDFPSNIQDASEESADSINNVMVPAFFNAEGELEEIKTKSGFVEGQMQSMQGKISDMGLTVEQIRLKYLNPFVLFWERIKPTVELAAESLGLYDKALGLTSTSIGNFKITLNDIREFIIKTSLAFADMNYFITSFRLHVLRAANAVVTLISVLSGNLELFKKSAKDDVYLGESLDRLSDNYSNLRQTALTELGKIEADNAAVMRNVADSIYGTAQSVQMQSTNLQTSVEDAFTGANTSVFLNTGQMSSNTNTAFSKMATDATTFSDNIYQSVNTNWGLSEGIVSSKNSSMVTDTDTKFSSMAENTAIKSTLMMTNMVTAFSEGKPAVDMSIGAVATIVDSSLSNVADGAKGHGEDTIKNFINGMISRAKTAATKGLFGPLGQLGAGAVEALSKAGFFAHGGMIPGAFNQAVPIIAHGGERVVPSTGADANMGRNSNVNINFYGGVQLDSEERVNQLARRITNILGRQYELAQYGINF